MNRAEARKQFETTIPAQFIADTSDPERDAMQAMLNSSTTFFSNCAAYQVVVEVVEATCCMARIQVGDRYVIQGAAICAEQSTGPNCVFLISMLVQRVAAAFERFGNEGEIKLTLAGAQCTDPGPVVGGFGGVKVKMWIEPIPE